MLLAGDRDRADLAGPAGRRERRAKGRPPFPRIGLARPIGAAHAMRGMPLRDDLPGVRIDDDDLGRLRRAVDARDQCSARHPTSG